MTGEDTLALMANVGMLSFLALSAYIVLVAGEMSFGQQAFFGLGAYGAGLATAVGAFPLFTGLAIAALIGAASAWLLGRLTLRLRGVYFSVSTLAFAESLRILLELFVYRRPRGEWSDDASALDRVGPDGSGGFGGIRYIFEHGISQATFVAIIYGLLGVVLASMLVFERSRAGMNLRMAGADPELAQALGVDVDRVRLLATTASGAVGALGGGLYAHNNTFIEPQNFDVMLGIHSLSYALIGGMGTPLGPLLGVLIDMVLLEGSRIFQGYRMLAFGGLVALLLVVRPRGLLDERTVRRFRSWIDGRSIRTLEKKS